MGIGSQRLWTPSKAQWSHFFQKLSLTHEDDSLASTNKETSFDKIFVLAVHHYPDDLPNCVLYYIDLSSVCKYSDSSIQTLQPILQFRDLLGVIMMDEYVVVGSKLFMFGGVDLRKWDSRRGWFYYDFSRHILSSTTITIEANSLESGPPMKGIKNNSPYVAVVGGYKICVFSSLLFKRHAECGSLNFEVFNTMEWSWTELPELANYSKYRLDEICIRSYCIVRSCLIICTDIGIYGINIDDLNRKWVKMEGSQSIDNDIGPFRGRFEVVGENVCGPYDVVRWGEVQRYPLAFENKGYFTPFDGYGGLLCSERVENGIVLCGVQGTHMRTCGPCLTRVPVLMVNVVKFDNELLEDLSGDMWKKIQSDKSSFFIIESQKCEHMELLGCFQYEEVKMMNPAPQMPLHYPKYKKADYENMKEWRLDLLLSQYGFTLNNATIEEKRDFAMGAFLWA